MIDSHCHLADEVFVPDLAPVIDRAKAAGVERALVVLEAGNAQEAERAKLVEALWPSTRFSIGVHPHHAHEFRDEPERAAVFVRRQCAATASARAVGEIGLDYHYDYSPPAVQRAVFRAQLRLARELRWPIVVHTREADDDTIRVLREEVGDGLCGVLHCFTGTDALADAALALGFYISFSGVVTFPRAEALRRTARRVPLDRLLTETDSPFLAPVPHRGKRNEPAHVARVVATLAEMHQLPPDDLGQRTAANFHALFRP